MGQRKVLSFIFMGVGIIGLLGSLLADVFGIGFNPGFGRLQVIGTIVGPVMIIIGVILKRK